MEDGFPLARFHPRTGIVPPGLRVRLRTALLNQKAKDVRPRPPPAQEPLPWSGTRSTPNLGPLGSPNTQGLTEAEVEGNLGDW